MSDTEYITEGDGVRSRKKVNQLDKEDDIKVFENAILDTLLKEDNKRGDCMKRKSSSLNQEEENQQIEAKKVKLVWGSPTTRLQDLQSSIDVFKILDVLRITEKAVCLGFEVDKTTMKCRLCGFMPTIMANLISHIKKAHAIDFKAVQWLCLQAQGL